MSKITTTIQEAEINYKSPFNDGKEPSKKFNEDTGEFSRFEFHIKPFITRQNKEDKEKPIFKTLPYKCVIWNEKLADKFLNNLDEYRKNYITLINAELTDFYIQEEEKENKEGKKYQAKSYKYFSLNIRDFIFSYKDWNQKEETEEVAEKQTQKKEIQEEEEDNIPF